jgi:hypothetical protein
VASEVVVEFFDSHRKLAARITVPERTMFWSDGRFEPGDAYAAHRDVFGRVEKASKRFQDPDAGDLELMALERAWQELNERFEIRERGDSRAITDVGLHLAGDQASIRY